MSTLEGKVVIVTGASSGIGEATARHLASLGARMVLGARRADRLQKLAAQLGESVIWRETDVTKLSQQQALAEQALKSFGRIDALINNAGIMPASPIAMGRVEDWDRMIDVNVRGVLYGIHAVLAHMLERGSGSIVNIASVSAHESHAGGAVYSATKFAVRAISEGLRKEVSGKVRVCMICPGLTESELPESLTVPAIREQARGMYQAAMPAAAIAEAVAYVLTQPAAVAVNEIIVRPLVAQAF
ncbi:MAG TPA: SDR family oxidoreductase [Steroidobacteraceae bacterium]|jgi:NADP-dependent 3-hydroxy acid dehydrogenase YdfG|nr:SDR family oxidoreductase [Steroidobacteraceae bacterium]